MQNIITTVLGVAVLCLLCMIGSSQSVQLSLRTQPRFVRIDPYTTSEAKVLCVLQDTAGRTVPLAGCQFTVDGQQEIWEFSQGPSSPRGSSGEWVGSYQGRGLQHGECGVTVTGFSYGDDLILGCRVRPANQDVWMYEAVLVYAISWSPMQFHLQPQVTLAAAGSDVTFNGAAEHELYACYFFLPPNNTVQLNFDDGPSSATQQHARYHGAGLRRKQCGVTLLDVKQERSGFVRGWVMSRVALSGRISMDFAQIIVLTAPEAPLLTVNATGLLAPGHVLHATCVVKNSRPVASLTWILGDEVIREDNINEAPLDSKWRWSHDLQTIEQHLEHVVTLSDDGKRLKCRASHVVLASGSQDSTSHVVLVFKGPRDPCQPNPCGDNSECRVEKSLTLCRCKEHFIGSPTHCQPECYINLGCESFRACVEGRCVDPCSSRTCGDGAQCHVAQHVAECRCPDGLVGDPLTRCEKGS